MRSTVRPFGIAVGGIVCRIRHQGSAAERGPTGPEQQPHEPLPVVRTGIVLDLGLDPAGTDMQAR